MAGTSRFAAADGQRFMREALARLGVPEADADAVSTMMLFADLRGFTSVAETLSAPELTSLVNEFFAAMTEEVLVTRKGQTTIPVRFRKKYSIRESTRLSN